MLIVQIYFNLKNNKTYQYENDSHSLLETDSLIISADKKDEAMTREVVTSEYNLRPLKSAQYISAYVKEAMIEH